MSNRSNRKNHDPKPTQAKNRDNPEQYPTEKISLFDLHESQKHVDSLPVEDLKIEIEEEKNKQLTKNTSSSKRKYAD